MHENILLFFLVSVACWHVIAIQVHYIANDVSQHKVLQLTLNRKYEIGDIPSCNVISFTDTQRHRLLSDANNIVVSSRKAEGQNELIKVFGYQESLVQAKASELCFNNLDVPMESNQGTFPYHLQSYFDIRSLPLDIQPLIVSGPAENRVDFTFFSDGCESS